MKEYFRNPREGLVKQIHEVVGLAHTGEHICEVGGSVIDKGDSLELKVIVTDTMKEVLDSAEKLESFDYSGIGKLHWFMSSICGDLTESAPFIIGNFFSFVQRKLFYAMGDLERGRKPQLNEADIAQLIKNLLRAQYFVTSEELGVGEPGFLAAFHVHINGGKPSEDDLYVSKKFPVVVFSAEKDYEKNRINVYCLDSGKVEWVEKV